MPSTYPAPIKHADFNTGSLANSTPPPSQNKPNSGSVGCPMKDVEPLGECAALEVWLQAEGDKRSTTCYKASDDPHADIAHDSDTRFHFAPGYEEVDIHWKHENPEHVEATVLEISILQNDAPTQVWKKTFYWTDCPETGQTRFKGYLNLHDTGYDFEKNAGLDEVDLDYDIGTWAAEFPSDNVTAQHSPYQIKMTVIPKETAKATNASVFMYFDVLIGGLELEMWPEDQVEKVLPNTNLDKHLAVYRSLTDTTDAENLSGAMPTGNQVKKVFLRSHTHYKDTPELANDVYYERYEQLWGDGPMIPLLVKVKILDSNDDPVVCLGGVGKIRLMWDWVDKGDLDWPGGDANIKTWLDSSRDYKAAATADSPAGKNCHVDRGGKRGPLAKPCFPPQAGKAPVIDLPDHNGSDAVFPFRVTRCDHFNATRKWCSYSETWPSGALQGRTGVLFQPSRMAGDGYELHAYVVYTDDQEMEQDVTPDNVPAALHAATGTFQVWRELEILKHWRMKTVSPTGQLLDLDAVRTKFKNYYINLKNPTAHEEDIGDWFTQLGTVITGNTLPDHIREAIDHTQRDELIHFKSYEDWFARMKVLHGPDDATLFNWANTVQNYQDPSGNSVQSSWQIYDGGSGMSVLQKPWPLQFEADDPTNQGEGKVLVHFPTLANKDIEIEFPKEGRMGNRGDTVTPTIQNKLNTDVNRAMLAHLQSLGENNFCSYQHPEAAELARHTPLRVQIKARNNKTRHQRRITRVKAALEEASKKVFYDAGESTYLYTVAKLGWGFIVFNATIDAALTAEFGTKDGLIAIQATDLSNYNLPKGKAFYANAAGTRALAACLDADPTQQTFEHEIGHALFLGHTYHSQAAADKNFFHSKDHPSNGNACVMHMTPSTSCTPTSLFCGFCLVKLWGWSVATVNPATGARGAPRTLYYDPDYNKNPGAPGPVPPHPTEAGANHATAVIP